MWAFSIRYQAHPKKKKKKKKKWGPLMWLLSIEREKQEGPSIFIFCYVTLVKLIISLDFFFHVPFECLSLSSPIFFGK